MKLFSLLILINVIILVSGCSNKVEVVDIECYRKADLSELYMKNNVSGIFDKLTREISALTEGHYSGKLKHIPILEQYSIIYGGSCKEVKFWDKKLAKDFNIHNIQESEYDMVYNEARGS